MGWYLLTKSARMHGLVTVSYCLLGVGRTQVKLYLSYRLCYCLFTSHEFSFYGLYVLYLQYYSTFRIFIFFLNDILCFPANQCPIDNLFSNG